MPQEIVQEIVIMLLRRELPERPVISVAPSLKCSRNDSLGYPCPGRIDFPFMELFTIHMGTQTTFDRCIYESFERPWARCSYCRSLALLQLDTVDWLQRHTLRHPICSDLPPHIRRLPLPDYTQDTYAVPRLAGV